MMASLPLDAKGELPAPRVWSSAWTLLAVANLLWAGNIVLARAASGVVPPVALAYWRWTGAFLVSLPFAWPLLRRDFPVLLRYWPIMLLLSATGIASYNAISYLALTRTTALNVLLLQSATPLIIVAWAFLLFGERPTPRQAAGVAVSLLGVAMITCRGSLAALAGLRPNPGDLWVVLALGIYGIYCVCLRRRPAVHPLSFLSAAMGLGSCMLLPFYLWEHAAGAAIRPGWDAWLTLGYMAVLPSFAAYMLFNRGIELIGAGRAGQSMHLMPLFGSMLAALLLGERLHPYHLAGIGLIGGGILRASARPLRRDVTPLTARRA